MAGKKTNKRDLDDIQVLGAWNFTIQPETPLVWLRTGPLDRYLMKFSIHSNCPSTAGMIFHAEADGPGIDGVSFWMERRIVDGVCTRRYVLAGDGLESRALATKKYPDPGGEASEEIELLVQGFTTVFFVRNRTVQIRCRTKASRGSISFFNSTKPDPEIDDADKEDAHFSDCRITALRRGPLEVSGLLARREVGLKKSVNKPPPQEEDEGALDPLQVDNSLVYEGREKDDIGYHESMATTAPSDSAGNSIRLTKASLGATRGGFRNTTGQLRMKSGNDSMMFSGRAKAGQNKMGRSISDGALRKGGAALCGLSPASKMRGFSGGGEWVALTGGLPTSEQQFAKEFAIRPLPAGQKNACQDFIKM